MLLSVIDHGPDIPEADRKHAVERFVRLEASRTLPGSGLGLSLASAVATLHGGELRLDDSHAGLTATLSSPRYLQRVTGLRPKRRTCHRRSHEYLRIGRAARQRAASSLPAAPLLNAWETGSPNWSAASAEIGAGWIIRSVKAILLGIVESSPYLFDLVRADPERMLRLLACDPEAHLAALMDKISSGVHAAQRS